VTEYIEALTLELKKGGGQMRQRTEREDAVAPSRVSGPVQPPGGR